MNLKLEHSELVLRFRDVIRLEDAAGTRLRILRGSVWITQHGDWRDYYLPASGTMTLDCSGLVLVVALEPTELAVRQPAPEISVAARVSRGLAGAWRALAGWVARRLGPEAIDNRRLRAWRGAS